MIRAVLWDFGGVVLESPFDAFERYERASDFPVGLVRTINSTNPDDNAWARLERSDVNLDEFVELFEAEGRALGHAVDGWKILDCIGGRVRPQMAEAVRRCSERLITACLTNNFTATDDLEKDPEREAEVAEVMQLFSEVVESRKVGVRKPDPRFYEIACDLLEIEPSEAVFLDDLGINLKPAKAMGMTTIKVVDPDDALTELEAAVGFPLR